jgi:hypothetical protein
MIYLAMLTLIGCTIRIEPLKPKIKYVYRHPHHKHHAYHAHPARTPIGTLVPEPGEEIKLLPQPSATPP